MKPKPTQQFLCDFLFQYYNYLNSPLNWGDWHKYD